MWVVWRRWLVVTALRVKLFVKRVKLIGCVVPACPPEVRESLAITSAKVVLLQTLRLKVGVREKVALIKISVSSPTLKA